MAEEAKWYVAHTYSGYENKVKEDLEKTVENRGLQDMILEVSYPTEEVVEMKDGKRKVVTRKLLPLVNAKNGFITIFYRDSRALCML